MLEYFGIQPYNNQNTCFLRKNNAPHHLFLDVFIIIIPQKQKIGAQSVMLRCHILLIALIWQQCRVVIESSPSLFNYLRTEEVNFNLPQL